jgi:hypothetical protein
MLLQRVGEGQIHVQTLSKQACQRRWIWWLPPMSFEWTRIVTVPDMCMVCERVCEGQFPLRTQNKQGLQLKQAYMTLHWRKWEEEVPGRNLKK